MSRYVVSSAQQGKARLPFKIIEIPSWSPRHDDMVTDFRYFSSKNWMLSMNPETDVKCELTGCEGHVPFSTQRGLRAHYVFRHGMPNDLALHESRAAFSLYHAGVIDINKTLSAGAAKFSHSDGVDAERNGNPEKTPRKEAVPTPLSGERSPETSAWFQTRLASMESPVQRPDSSPDGTMSEFDSDMLDDDSELEFTDPDFESTFKPLLPLAFRKLQEGYSEFCNRPSDRHSENANNLPEDAKSTKCVHASGKNVGKRKRMKTFEDGDDGEGDEPSKNPRQAGPQEIGDEIPRLLACPYYKFNSRRHASCRGYTLRGIRDIK